VTRSVLRYDENGEKEKGVSEDEGSLERKKAQKTVWWGRDFDMPQECNKQSWY
jgi:predicted PolB exonuclease-like 3'-5' exonuclease